MQFFESHFWYNRNQRNGILILIGLILILQAIYFFVDFSNEEITFHEEKIIQYQAHLDSLKEIKALNSKPKIYPFNPNYITDYKGYLLGMTIEEIDRLLLYRKSGNFVNSNQEFQKITQVSDSLLESISPYFKFPDWVSKATTKKKLAGNQIFKIQDLNEASINDLLKINGIGQKLASRIIAYRELVSGFTFDDQLYEVYYLRKEQANLILKRFRVMTKPEIKKININDASFKEVLHTPYINYNLTKKIFNYRDQVKLILSLNELKTIDSFPLDRFERITLYLSTE